VGDDLLRAAAGRLRAAARTGDLLGRLGGDEFVVAQRGVGGAKGAEALAGDIVKKVSQPYTLGGHDVATSASIGVALAPQDGADSAALLRCADLALYTAKASGRRCFRLFDPEMDDELKERRRIERAIREATAAESFELHFQPLVDTATDALVGFEALLRLPKGDGEAISPAVFVPIAEEMGLISRIGAWVVRRACTVAATWPEYLTVSVNLSPAQFDDAGIVEVVRAALEESGLEPRRLELEITEGLLLNDTELVIGQLRDLKALGVSIAMDDFGTGYSSLSYLWRFPFDKIKIDRSFMRASQEDGQNVSDILRTIIALGHSLDMQVTTEGVETRNQAELLRDLECDYTQGYHFGRPMHALDAAARILRDLRRRSAMAEEEPTPQQSARRSVAV
jgi:predicted signal transduction protein with EAL and GGDEF domain